MKIFITLLSAIILQITDHALYAQTKPENQIIVYFANGVQKNALNKTAASITSAGISSVLSRYNLTASTMKAAFSDFNEADTVDALKGEESRQMNKAKVFIITLPDTASRSRLLSELNAMPEVLYAEPDGQTTLGLIPNDAGFNQQWNMRNTVTPGADIHAEGAWDLFTGNPNAIIAIVDNGVDVAHNDLNIKTVNFKMAILY